MKKIQETLKNIFTPFSKIDKSTRIIISLVQAILILTILQFSESNVIPKPSDVAGALSETLQSRNFYEDLLSSLTLTVKSMGIAITIALIFSYIFLIPFFEGISKFITYFRFLTLTGLSFVFLLLIPDAGTYKISLMLFGIIPFFITSLISTFSAINKQELELAKTLRMNNWQSWYEIVIVGRLDQVITTISTNFAIGWGMISFVESQAMSEGGLGTIMAKNMKYFHLPEVFAILLVIFSFGILSDFVLSYLRKLFFPYTAIQKI